jgi:hypothetical protein
MPIQYRCTSCNNIVQTPDDSGGKQGRCPHCSQVATIPMTSTVSQDAPSPVNVVTPQPQAGTNPFAEPIPKPTYGTPANPAFAQGPTQYGYGQPMPGAVAQPGYGYPGHGGGYGAPGYGSEIWSDKSKIAAGLLGIFVGGWGVHRFYLGFVSIGLLQIFVTLATCGIGGLWGFIEGILYLTGSMDRDVDGRKLRD